MDSVADAYHESRRPPVPPPVAQRPVATRAPQSRDVLSAWVACGSRVIAGIAVALVVSSSTARRRGRGRVTPTEQNGAVPRRRRLPRGTGPRTGSQRRGVHVRDIFDPLAARLAAETATTANDTTTTVDTSEYAADTLYLLNILTDGTTQWALMVWDQKEIQLAEGDVISGTPWKVLDIRTDDVVMLYGDQQVVLSVGQGITK